MAVTVLVGSVIIAALYKDIRLLWKELEAVAGGSFAAGLRIRNHTEYMTL